MAFLDSGFYPHPDLTRPENRILQSVDATGERAVEEASFLKAQVSSWHGMMTSCVAAGSGFMSDELYRGIASQASLVLVKTGSPNGRGIREVDILRALNGSWQTRTATDIRVVNISLGGDHPANGKLSELDRLVEQAVEQGMVVVAASGNGESSGSSPRRVRRRRSPSAGWTTATLTTPDSGACTIRTTAGAAIQRPSPTWSRRLPGWLLPCCRTAGCTTKACSCGGWTKPSSSSCIPMGRPPGVNKDASHPQLAAFRRKIRLRMIDQKYIHPHYQHVDGTSMAAPVVSAIVAQMLEANPTLSPSQVREILLATATPLPGLPAARYGAGLVNAGRAVAAARRLSRGLWRVLPFRPRCIRTESLFYYFSPGNRAACVSLIGSFNNWDPTGYELHSHSPGLWQLAIPSLPRGAYRYKFLVDGAWVNDPENPDQVEDGYGGFSSLLEV